MIVDGLTAARRRRPERRAQPARERSSKRSLSLTLAETKMRQTASNAIVSGANPIPLDRGTAAALAGIGAPQASPFARTGQYCTSRQDRDLYVAGLRFGRRCARAAKICSGVLLCGPPSDWKTSVNKKPAAGLPDAGSDHLIDDRVDDAIMLVICPTCQTLTKCRQSMQRAKNQCNSFSARQAKSPRPFRGAGSIMFSMMSQCS